MSVWVSGIGAAVSIGTTAYSVNANKKLASQSAAQQQAALAGLQAPHFAPYEPIDVMGIVREAAGWNSGEGTTQALGMATRINRRATSDVERAMMTLFGGREAYTSQRDATNDAVNQWLAGDVSPSTRRSLGRQALSTGADMGSGAVGDLYAGYLGLTQEQIVGQGVDAYRSLYSMYRQSVPLVSGANMLPFTSIAPGDAVQFGLYNELNRANSEQALAGMQYGFQLDTITGGNSLTSSLAGQRMDGNTAMAGSLASGAGTVLGAYSANRAANNRAQVTTPSAYSAGSGRPVSQRPPGL
jgi:hypothetical protein